MAAARRSESLLSSLVAGVVPLVLRLLARTWAVRVVGRRVLDAGRPAVVVVWHQMVIPGVTFFRDRGGVLMVSRSRDGDLISRVGRRMGFGSVRGSSSRGGGEALLELIEAVRQGRQAAFTVDGPRGPARDPKIGCVLAASRTGAPIVPVGCAARGVLRARSWDRTLIPLPFASLVLCVGEPFTVPADASEADLERARLRVRDALVEAERRAEESLRS